RCIADGTVVAARLSEDDGDKPDDGKTDRNFVLVKHRVAGELEGEAVSKPLWSLYYHLGAVPYDKESDDAKKLAWFHPMLEGYEDGCELGKLYYKIVTDEDEDSGGTKGLNMRKKAKGDIVKVVPEDAIVEILDDKLGNSWANVKHEGSEGFVYSKGERVQLIDPEQFKTLGALAVGQVVKLAIGIHAGDVIGKAGKIDDVAGWHFETFSEQFFDHVEGLAGLTQWKDEDNDALIDVATLGEALGDGASNWSPDAALDDDESKNAAPNLHDVAAFHMSEWAAEDWSRLQGAPWNLNATQFAEHMQNIGRMQWWTQASAAGADLPGAPKVWHYHPVKFVAEMRKLMEEPGPEEPSFLEFEFTDRGGEPLANEKFTVTFSDGETQDGTTDANGKARLDDVPPGTATVEFPELQEAGAGD
ncbi:carboxypeptidase-like regulatory domain-containing protein, partial [Planctomycetota bacterium]|nr:carboxypeptidase-like regulatory domain-containing protein [Planctomycetota bacterium]